MPLSLIFNKLYQITELQFNRLHQIIPHHLECYITLIYWENIANKKRQTVCIVYKEASL